MSCYSLQREKVWKIKIPKCHKNVRFGSDLPTNGSLPFKEIIHLASHLAIKNETVRFPEALGSQQLPLRSFFLRAQTPEQEELLPLLHFRGGENLATSLRCLNWAWTRLQAWPWPPWLVVTSDPPILPGRFTRQSSFALELLHGG